MPRSPSRSLTGFSTARLSASKDGHANPSLGIRFFDGQERMRSVYPALPSEAFRVLPVELPPWRIACPRTSTPFSEGRSEALGQGKQGRAQARRGQRLPPVGERRS